MSRVFRAMDMYGEADASKPQLGLLTFELFAEWRGIRRVLPRGWVGTNSGASISNRYEIVTLHEFLKRFGCCRRTVKLAKPFICAFCLLSRSISVCIDFFQ